jgi:hypothetical protein
MFNTRNKSGISAHPCIILYIFKELVNIILQRSVKNMLSLLTQRERSIILCSSGMDSLGVLGEGVLCEILGNYQTK